MGQKVNERNTPSERRQISMQYDAVGSFSLLLLFNLAPEIEVITFDIFSGFRIEQRHPCASKFLKILTKFEEMGNKLLRYFILHRTVLIWNCYKNASTM